VAMGRAIVRDPAVFLMDEPLSNLDARLRVQIRTEIAALQRRMGTTTVYVTHDQVEAMTLGNRVAVLSGGELQQVAAPQELYQRPANVFVAEFIGSPGMNIFATVLRRGDDGGLALALGARLLALPAEVAARHPGLHGLIGQPVLAGIRPEALLLPASSSDGAALHVTVNAVELLGHEMLIYFSTGHELGETGTQMVARLPAMQPVKVGSGLSLVLDTASLYFFNAQGEAID